MFLGVLIGPGVLVALVQGCVFLCFYMCYLFVQLCVFVLFVFCERRRLGRHCSTRRRACWFLFFVCWWVGRYCCVCLFMMQRNANKHNKQTNKQANKQSNKQTCKQTNTQANAQTNNQTIKQASKQTQTQTNKQTNKRKQNKQENKQMRAIGN